MEMRSTARSRRRRHGWRWLIGLIVVLVLLIGGATIVSVAMHPVTAARERVTELAVKRNKITSATQFYAVSRNDTYYSVVGENKKHQKIGVIVKGKSKKLVTVKMADGVSAAEVRQLVKSKYNPKRITSLGLAIYKQVPVWEVTFIDRQGNLNFITYQFADGKADRTIQHL